MTQHTMVFGDDGSTCADLAWLWINNHRWPAWHLDIITAVQAPSLRITEATDLHEWKPDNPRRAFTESELTDITTLSCEQDPRIALTRPADLLVIGPRGPGLAKALHLGSTAEWLMSHPPAPMVVARHGRRTRTVLLCHDGSRHAELATAAMCALPWISDVTATVISVDDGRTDAEGAVDSATSALQRAGVEVTHRIFRGDPTESIINHLQYHPTEMVALGTRGLTGMRRLRVGSTAGVIAHDAGATLLLACADNSGITSLADP